jgi:CubicO group peptidase (beta-lactamase class C family)
LAGCNPVQPQVAAPAATATPTHTTPYFPGSEWRSSTPEEQGIDSQGIVAMFEQITRESLAVHSFILIRNGYVVTEAYFAPIGREHKHILYSGTKSFTSALTGIAIQEGFIKGVDQKVLDFFPEIKKKNQAEAWNELTVEHLLTMSVGQEQALAPGIYSNDDYVEQFLTQKIVTKPGSAFLYNSGAPHTLAAIIQKTTGKPLLEYAAEKLFAPLGITDYSWLADAQGRNFGNSWLRLRPLDMAKFGYLYLQKGLWQGQQVISPDWVEKSTHKHIETRGLMNSAEDDGYGYYWWVNSFGGYSAHGFAGQFIFVVPAANLVAVFTGGFAVPDFPTDYELMKTHIIPAVKAESPLAKNEQADQALTRLIHKVGSQPPSKPVAALPEIAKRISGQPYKLDHPTVESITLNFDDTAEYKVNTRVLYQDKKYELAYIGGLDDTYRLGQNIDITGPYIAGYKGFWQDDKTFIQYEYPTDRLGKSIFKCLFEKDQLTLTSQVEVSGQLSDPEIVTGTSIGA